MKVAPFKSTSKTKDGPMVEFPDKSIVTLKSE